MAKLRMSQLYEVELMGAQSLDLQDSLILIGVSADDLEEAMADRDVQHAYRCGLARGLKEITGVIRREALGGHIGAAKSLLTRNGYAADEVDAAEAKRRVRRVMMVDVLSSVADALAKQRALIEGMDDES
jgi:hypothetical protein